MNAFWHFILTEPTFYHDNWFHIFAFLMFWTIVATAPYVALLYFLVYRIQKDDPNWTTVKQVGGYKYQEHKFKRKRRLDTRVPNKGIDDAWLKFKKDVPE